MWDKITCPSIPKLQQCNRMDKSFYPTLHSACDYLSRLGLKLIHMSEMGPRGLKYPTGSFPFQTDNDAKRVLMNLTVMSLREAPAYQCPFRKI